MMDRKCDGEMEQEVLGRLAGKVGTEGSEVSGIRMRGSARYQQGQHCGKCEIYFLAGGGNAYTTQCMYICTALIF